MVPCGGRYTVWSQYAVLSSSIVVPYSVYSVLYCTESRIIPASSCISVMSEPLGCSSDLLESILKTCWWMCTVDCGSWIFLFLFLFFLIKFQIHSILKNFTQICRESASSSFAGTGCLQLGVLRASVTALCTLHALHCGSSSR